jgi:hypothetical protein
MSVSRGGTIVAAIVALNMIGLATAGGSLATPQSRVLWKARYDGKAHGSDAAIRDAVSPDGSTVFTTGYSAGTGGNDFATIAYDAGTGAKLWTARYDGPAHGEDDAIGVVTSRDGSTVFVTGGSLGISTGFDQATIAYDSATGKKLWASRYNGPGNGDDGTISLGVSIDDSLLFVAGDELGPAGNRDSTTVAYDTTNGNQVWVREYDGPAHGDDDSAALTVGPNGTVYVMGRSVGVGTGIDITTIAYKPATGKRLWVSRYDGPTHSNELSCIFTCVETSPDGSQVYSLGQGPGNGTGIDIVLIAYDAVTGAQNWAVRYAGPGSGTDQPADLAVLADGSGVIVSGIQQQRVGVFDIVNLSYAPSDGSQQWMSLYDGPSHGDDQPSTITSTPYSKTVVLTGLSNNDGLADLQGRDMFTAAFATGSGKKLWTARYDGPANGEDEGSFVELSPDGATAYVTGDSTGKSNTLDIETLAYRVG